LLESDTQMKHYMMMLKWNLSLCVCVCHTKCDASLLDDCSRSAQINGLHDGQQGVFIRHEECHAGITDPHVWSAGRSCGRWHGVHVKRTILPAAW